MSQYKSAELLFDELIRNTEEKPINYIPSHRSSTSSGSTTTKNKQANKNNKRKISSSKQNQYNMPSKIVIDPVEFIDLDDPLNLGDIIILEEREVLNETAIKEKKRKENEAEKERKRKQFEADKERKRKEADFEKEKKRKEVENEKEKKRIELENEKERKRKQVDAEKERKRRELEADKKRKRKEEEIERERKRKEFEKERKRKEADIEKERQDVQQKMLNELMKKCKKIQIRLPKLNKTKIHAIKNNLKFKSSPNYKIENLRIKAIPNKPGKFRIETGKIAEALQDHIVSFKAKNGTNNSNTPKLKSIKIEQEIYPTIIEAKSKRTNNQEIRISDISEEVKIYSNSGRERRKKIGTTNNSNTPKLKSIKIEQEIYPTIIEAKSKRTNNQEIRISDISEEFKIHLNSGRERQKKIGATSKINKLSVPNMYKGLPKNLKIKEFEIKLKKSYNEKDSERLSTSRRKHKFPPSKSNNKINSSKINIHSSSDQFSNGLKGLNSSKAPPTKAALKQMPPRPKFFFKLDTIPPPLKNKRRLNVAVKRLEDDQTPPSKKCKDNINLTSPVVNKSTPIKSTPKKTSVTKKMSLSPSGKTSTKKKLQIIKKKQFLTVNKLSRSYTNTELANEFGRNFFKCHIKCYRNPLKVLDCDILQDVEARKTRTKYKGGLNKSVSFREDVEIFGVETDLDDNTDDELVMNYETAAVDMTKVFNKPAKKSYSPLKDNETSPRNEKLRKADEKIVRIHSLNYVLSHASELNDSTDFEEINRETPDELFPDENNRITPDLIFNARGDVIDLEEEARETPDLDFNTDNSVNLKGSNNNEESTENNRNDDKNDKIEKFSMIADQDDHNEQNVDEQQNSGDQTSFGNANHDSSNLVESNLTESNVAEHNLVNSLPVSGLEPIDNNCNPVTERNEQCAESHRSSSRSCLMPLKMDENSKDSEIEGTKTPIPNKGRFFSMLEKFKRSITDGNKTTESEDDEDHNTFDATNNLKQFDSDEESPLNSA